MYSNEENKTTFIKNIFERLPLHSAKLTETQMAALDLKKLSSKYLTKIIGFKLGKHIKFAILRLHIHGNTYS